MRLFLLLVCLLLFNEIPENTAAKSANRELILVVEVEGDIQRKEKWLNQYYPRIDVLETYDILLNGLAVRGQTEELHELANEGFVTNVHPVATYQSVWNFHDIFANLDRQNNHSAVLPSALNDTEYTGSGIKIAVIDTGIDYNHPDLEENYQGGKDVVDYDDYPMETKGAGATSHGTHVSGIIGANGQLKGVAPHASLLGYRALGPGGSGTSVQVIAAMEEAIRDRAHIINLSLGNAVNGPDYPTSLAVNRAAELGVAVVVANGNTGPGRWTVGAPATATKALAVGALAQKREEHFFYDPVTETKIASTVLEGSADWEASTTRQLVVSERSKNTRNHLILVRNQEGIEEKIDMLEQAGSRGVILYGNEKEIRQKRLEEQKERTISVFAIDEEREKDFIKNVTRNNPVFIDEKTTIQSERVASFSSRGPVTSNWSIKPDVLAPGVDVLSTVPGNRYEAMSGTSMAAPHVAGVLALIQEANEDWTVEQQFAALKTTAKRLPNTSALEQGMGLVRAKEAIETETLIYDSLLTFGRTNRLLDQRSATITIENTTDKKQTYMFHQPKKRKGLIWKLPWTIHLAPYEKKEVSLTMDYQYSFLRKGIEEGVLKLERHDKKTYDLPYIILNDIEVPKITSFSLQFNEVAKDYVYELSTTEDVFSVDVHLYNRDTLVKERTIIKNQRVTNRYFTGRINKELMPEEGHYIGEVTAKMRNGTYKSIHLPVTLRRNASLE